MPCTCIKSSISNLFFFFFRKAREDEAAATRRLNEMIANYGDVIPRRDFEQLQKDHIKMEEQQEQAKADYDKLKEEHE